MNSSLVNSLFYEEPAGAFLHGHIFVSAPDLESAQQDPANGYWHCNIADNDKLTWSERVYELFGLPPGVPIERDEAVARYAEHSKVALERVRNYALSRRRFGFILDAEITPDGAGKRWIRVLAVPILTRGRVVALHGLKRAL